jgi:hypothetical protein
LILVDSSVWIDYFNGRITPQTDQLDQLLDREFLAIGARAATNCFIAIAISSHSPGTSV